MKRRFFGQMEENQRKERLVNLKKLPVAAGEQMELELVQNGQSAIVYKFEPYGYFILMHDVLTYVVKKPVDLEHSDLHNREFPTLQDAEAAIRKEYNKVNPNE